MPLPGRGARELIREGRSAVHEALARSHLVRAWESLQERDAEGNARGALPYTEQALAQLAAAHSADPDDVGIVHHLAVAHHAYAWALEIRGDPRAAQEWERALGHWRTVAASRGFWGALEAKLLALDPQASPEILTDLRRDLLENLLDIHVDFIRHYCEGGTPDRAKSHLDIVARAMIPPAVKRRLTDKVFEAMTGPVPDAKATQAYDSALTTVERFLDLFPDHLPALRMHAEVCKEWVSGISYQKWDDIVSLASRSEPYARRLAEHPALGDEALARTALEDLAAEFALRGRDRGVSYAPKDESQPVPVADRDAGRAAFEFGMNWGRLAYPRSPSGSRVRAVFGACVNGQVVSLHEEATEVLRADIEEDLKVATAVTLYRRAVELSEEALASEPNDETHSKNLDALRGMLEQLGDGGGFR